MLIRFLGWFYLRCLNLYPAEFRNEFEDEIKAVFIQAIDDFNRTGEALKFVTHELRDLPGSLLHAYLVSWLRERSPIMNDKYISPSTRWQALLGILPFLAFGISSMIGKVEHHYLLNQNIAEMIVYGLALVGLLIGWTRGFPLWSNSYLGWSLVLAWSNTNISINGVRWGYQVWILLGIIVLAALIWTRSIQPLKKLIKDVWLDWTRLTLSLFAFGAFVSLIFDENHNPYLLLWMALTTIIIATGVWLFLRSSTLSARVLSIVVSFIASMVPGAISYLTWDWRAYYGLPKSDYWYDNLGVSPILVLFWLLFLFSPALIVFIQRMTRRQIA
jgi:hypothetical protein